MALTQHQRAILEYIADTEKTKSQIVNRFGGWYLYNSNKHIGDILSRMCNSKLLIRVKRGVFKRGTGGEKFTKEQISIKNKLLLF